MTGTLRIGVARGRIELRQTLTNAGDLWKYLFPAIGLLATIFFMADARLPGTDLSLGAATLPAAIGMGLAFAGLLTTAQQLVVERDDGTLLRAKAVPNGMAGYLVGKLVLVGGMTLLTMAIQLLPAWALLVPEDIDASGWMTLLWLLPLGFVATAPIGAVIGSLIENPRNLGLVMLPTVGVIAISGVYYPISALAGWLETIGQLFPFYWVGLGARSALLPDAYVAAELGQSWRHLETAGVLALWAVAGLALAPAILRRMARRESGSAVAARRERALNTRAM
jgi:ABC-2 type transport system permease protein